MRSDSFPLTLPPGKLLPLALLVSRAFVGSALALALAVVLAAFVPAVAAFAAALLAPVAASAGAGRAGRAGRAPLLLVAVVVIIVPPEFPLIGVLGFFEVEFFDVDGVVKVLVEDGFSLDVTGDRK